jgi:hypothetical protein
VKKWWTTFLGFIPVAPNSLAINTVDGKKLVLYLLNEVFGNQLCCHKKEPKPIMRD